MGAAVVDRTADFLAALERCARAVGTSGVGAQSSPNDAAGLRKRRGTLLSRQQQSAVGESSPQAHDNSSGSGSIEEMVGVARRQLRVEDRERAMQTRSGRFVSICEEKMLEVLSLGSELQRLDKICRLGYGGSSSARRVAGGTDDDVAEMEELAVQRLSSLQRDVDRLQDAAAFGGSSNDGDAVKSAHRHGMVRMHLSFPLS